MSTATDSSLTGLDGDEVIARLKLVAHPEGGHYRETFRDPDGPAGRGHSSAIYYLLKAGERSRWHRIDAAEVWHFYAGAALKLEWRNGDDRVEELILGQALEQGQQPQAVVPAGCWQQARPLGAWTLVGCTVAPGFSFERFELER